MAVLVSPDEPEFRFDLAVLLLATGEPAAAERHLREAGSGAAVRAALSLVLRALGRTAEADAERDAAVAADADEANGALEALGGLVEGDGGG